MKAAQAAGAGVVDLDADRKAFDDLRANAALCGCGLYRLENGGFLLSRWGLTREFSTTESLENVLRQMGRP